MLNFKFDQSPPVAMKKPEVFTLHGHNRIDNYAWLKDPNWQRVMLEPDQLSSDIRAYLEAENQYLEAVLENTESLQELLFKELRSRIKENDKSVPEKDGKFYYYIRYEQDQQYPIFCRYPTADSGNEEILLNGNITSEEYTYFDIGEATHSPNHQYFAYSIDTKGSEFYTLIIKDLFSGRLLEDKICNVQSDFIWAQDNRSIFYTTLDDSHRPDKVLRHIIGTNTDNDQIVYKENDPGFFVSLDITESREFILISAHNNNTSEVHLVDAHHPELPSKLFAKRECGLEYNVTHHEESFFIVTNKDGAEDYKVMQCPLHDTEKNNWKDFYVPPSNTLLLNVDVFKMFFVRTERINGLPKITASNLRDNNLVNEHLIEFDEEAYEARVLPGYEFDTDILRFSYTSMTTPTQIYDYKMSTFERELKKQQKIPCGHNPENYITRRLFASTIDNETVPISLLYKKNTKLDGNSPLLLYAYGSYGSTMPANFSSNRLSLVNRGFIFAIAHVRGGMEKGYAWYTKGKLEHKINTFKDTIACAEYLINKKFTKKGNIAIHGGSAGGMLVGAVINMRPGLFRAAIADVPFVDVLTTMCDSSLPLTPPEWTEWGNPLDSKDAYKNIIEYSPYDNVKKQFYPHILVTAGLTDPRVTYWEPAKWVAKLRDQKIDNNILLLKTNLGAGHAGATGRFDFLKEIALMYAFLLKVFNINHAK